MAVKMLTPKEIAADWEISPKTLRKFLRKDEKAISAQGGETPGKGGRWAIPANSLKGLKTRFDAWTAANAAKQAEKDAEPEGDETEVDLNPGNEPVSALLDALDAMPEDEGNDA